MSNNLKQLISIIIPIYNAEKTLHIMINCLLNQTYKNFEVILVDDGSTDSSLELCYKLSRENSNFKVYSKNNQGAYSARNLGLQKSQGEYIAFLDADDKIDSNYLEILLTACKDADIAICDVSIEKNGIEINKFTHQDSILSRTEAINELLKRKSINSGPCAKLFKKKLISGLHFPPLRVYEDILFVLETFKRSNRIAITNKTSYHYEQFANSTMGSLNKVPSCDIIVATDEIIEFIQSTPNLDEKCTYITVSHLFQYALPLAISNSYKDCEFLKLTRKLYNKYMQMILKCSAIPWKEKIIFLLFSKGFIVNSRQIKRIRKIKKYE